MVQPKPIFMNLDVFITETLKSIIKGTKDAQDYARENEGRINPIRLDRSQSESIQYPKETTPRPLTMINFDVAVTASSTSEKGFNGGISVMALNVGGKGSISNANQVVSRISFGIGIVLPNEIS
jgi:hypothetical protein